MKARFMKGHRSRTVIVRNKIIYIIFETLQPIRFDMNNFEKEKEKIMAFAKDDPEVMPMFEKISKLKNDDDIMEDIVLDYKKDGWLRG